MQVVRFKDADSYEPEKGWRRVSLAGSDSVSIEYFEKLRGHASPMHKHENRQILIVLKGKMKVCTEDEEVVLGEMDSVCLDENEPHVVENIGEGQSVGIDIFAPGRSFDFWLRRSD
jgi:quercetin dioxygenase-like cupin family protein